MSNIKPEDFFKNVVSHSKEYGFIFQSSEIYDGLSAVYDYGQLGAELKKNIRDYWWKAMVQMNENIVGIDASIFMHPTTWKASGHVDAFNDPLIDPAQQRDDYSIKKELSNGGLNIILRNMPRKYDLSFMAPKAQYDLIDNLYLANGSLPVGILLSDNMYLAGVGDQWSGFFHVMDPPGGKFNNGLLYTGWSITIKEAV